MEPHFKLIARNFRTLEALEWSPQVGVNLLVGPNGSGKTTVLSALKQQTNVAAAARPLGIHLNSFRARLERITEISGIDLNDQAMRLRTILAFVASPEIHNAALRNSWPDRIVTHRFQ